jgi:hypothetical protein
MIKSIWLLLTILLTGATGCGMFKRLPPAPKQYGPYLFVAEDRKFGALNIGSRTPISPREVLLFPITTERLSSGNWLVSLGHPVLYQHMTDVMDVKFRGIDGSVTNVAGFIVWAHDYYPERIVNRFMRGVMYEGECYPLHELTPLLPGTDRKKMVEAILNELKKGEIEVQRPL